jgi:hypothetical protein
MPARPVVGEWEDRGRAWTLILVMVLAMDFGIVPAMGAYLWFIDRVVGIAAILIGIAGGIFSLWFFGKIRAAETGTFQLWVQGMHPETSKQALSDAASRLPGKNERLENAPIPGPLKQKYDLQYRLLDWGLDLSLRCQEHEGRWTAAFRVSTVTSLNGERGDQAMRAIRDAVQRAISPPAPQDAVSPRTASRT